MTHSQIPKSGACSLCGGRYCDYGNNPAPLRAVDERCCDACNRRRVIPARLRRMAKDRREGAR
jgi:hypothetical protein